MNKYDILEKEYSDSFLSETERFNQLCVKLRRESFREQLIVEQQSLIADLREQRLKYIAFLDACKTDKRLKGVSRKRVLELAREKGLSAHEEERRLQAALDRINPIASAIRNL